MAEVKQEATTGVAEQEVAVAAAGAQLAAQQNGKEQPVQMSKSQMKKQKKRQMYEERKRLFKERERAQKQAEQEKRREEGRKRIEAMTEEEREKYREERNAKGVARKQERQEKKAAMEKALEVGQKIVLDLDFADLMSDAELKSICSQLGYCWHANCAAQLPAHLVLSSMQGKMADYMKRQVSGHANWKATITEKPYIEHFADVDKQRLVYLTADSENVLEELDPEAIYIIGGIVDRNRHKQLCFNKAVEQGISHAQLPIGDYMRLASSRVMTTNHCLEIILRWMELRDWKKAFESVIPPRKRQQAEGGGEEEEGEGGDQQQEEQPAAKRQAVGEVVQTEQQQQQAAAGDATHGGEERAEKQQQQREEEEEGRKDAAATGESGERSSQHAASAAAQEGNQ